MPRYASGRYALGICDRCGLRTRLLNLVREAETGLMVHPSCEDDPIPRARPLAPAVVLRNPRPDSNEGGTQEDDG